MALNLSKNLKTVLSTATLRSLGYNLIGSAIYLGVPTLTKVNGTPGALLGTGAAVVASILSGNPAIAVGGLTTMLTHAAYVYVNPRLYAKTGTAFFGWSEDNYSLPAAGSGAATTTPQVNDQVRRVTLPSGKTVETYPGSSLSGITMIGAGKPPVALNDIPTTQSATVLNFGARRRRSA